MNILNLLTKKEYVAGIEFSDSFIRIIYKRAKKNDKDELVFVEEKIPENTILNGVILDKNLFEKILEDIWKREKLEKNYAVITIPEDKIYSHIFQFPKNITKNGLEEAIKLAIDFQIPFKKEDMYISWENTNNPSHTINEILVSAIQKNTADEYIKILNNIGINILALESHLSSFARSVKQNKDETILFVKKNANSVTIFNLKNNILEFSRTIPNDFIKNEKILKEEVIKIKNSFESDKKESISILSTEESVLKDDYIKYQKISEDAKLEPRWFITLGAFVRGEIPKEDDEQISLLPVGTKEAYIYQKTKIFITLIRNIIIGVSILFLFTFLLAYIFIFSLSQKINTNVNKIVSIYPISQETIVKELLVKKTNELGNISKIILSETVNWSILIDEIISHTTPGIVISNFSVSGINDNISLTGISQNRDNLNQFKKSLQSSTYLTNVNLPITNLEKKGDIPFSITFHIKDPNMLYYK